MKRPSVKHLRLALFLLLDRVLMAWPHRFRTSRTVLLVRTDAIGDFVLWLDAAKELSRFYKDNGYQVLLLANALWADLAQELRIFDEVIAVERRRFESDLGYRNKIARQLRSRCVEITVNPVHSRDHFSDSLVRLSGAPERIGICGDSANLPGWQARFSTSWYTRLIPTDPSLLMEIPRNAAFTRQLTRTSYVGRVADLRCFRKHSLSSRLLDDLAGKSYFVLFPSSSRPEKCWPTINFARVAESLSQRTGWQGVVCGGPGDVAVADALCQQAGTSLLNWAGRTTLSEFAVVLARANVLIANDTAAIHIAAAVSTPSLCILGGGQYGRFLPYQVEDIADGSLPVVVTYAMPCFSCNWCCVYSLTPRQAYPCVQNVPIETVWKALQTLLWGKP